MLRQSRIKLFAERAKDAAYADSIESDRSNNSLSVRAKGVYADRDVDNKKVIKVFQALGYKVIDNWADYVRNKEKTLKEKIYSKLCSGCVNEIRCHETCEHCDAYYGELEKKGIKED